MNERPYKRLSNAQLDSVADAALQALVNPDQICGADIPAVLTELVIEYKERYSKLHKGVWRELMRMTDTEGV